MKVSDLMQTLVESCGPEACGVDVAALMGNEDCGLIPVVAGRKPQGVITDRDIAVRVVSAARNPREVVARDVMSTRVVCVSRDATLDECCGLMGQHKLRRLLVVDKDGDLCGVVSTAEIARTSPPQEA